MEITSDLINFVYCVGSFVLICCIVYLFTTIYHIMDNYFNEKGKELKNKREIENEKRDNYIIDSILFEVREIVREELDKK